MANLKLQDLSTLKKLSNVELNKVVGGLNEDIDKEEYKGGKSDGYYIIAAIDRAIYKKEILEEYRNHGDGVRHDEGPGEGKELGDGLY